MKRLKLILTIGALCMAISLLAFGAYAVSKIDMGVQSTVSYEFDDVVVEVTSTITGYKIAQPATSENAISTALATPEEKVEVFSSLTIRTFEKTASPTDPYIVTDPAPVGVVVDGGTVSDGRHYNFNKAYLYKFEITISAPTIDGVVITYTLPEINQELAKSNLFIVADTENNHVSGNRITKEDGTVSISYYIGLIDEKTSIGKGEIAAITKGAIVFSN